MKRLIISLSLLLAVTFSANAQLHHRPGPRHPIKRYYAPAPHPKHHHPGRYEDNWGELRFHLAGELGMNDIYGIFVHEYPYHYSIGGMIEAQVGRLLSLGLGAEYYGTRSLYAHHANKPYLNCVPIYGNIRLATPGRAAQLFVEARAGYAIPTGSVFVNGTQYRAKGFFTGAGVGISCYGNNFSIGVNALDVNNGYNQSMYHTSSDIITDVYLRYSYAIPLY